MPMRSALKAILSTGLPLPLLDTIGAATQAAWSSARRLRLSYTGNLIRLRRSSDNAESNFGFTSSGILDVAAVAAWLGADSGFFVTLYDQSGNGKDLTQATAGNQPSYSATGANNKAAIVFDGSNDYLSRADFPALAAATAAIVVKSANSNSKYALDIGGGTHALIQGYTATKWEWYSSPRTVIGTISTTAFQTIIFNGATSSDTASGLGAYMGTPADFWGGTMPEAIVWSVALTTAQQALVAANQGAFYGY